MTMHADIPLVEEHIRTLRRWIAETKRLEKARQRNAEILPRIGIRDGRSTSNEAHHIRCAEEVRRCAEQALEEAARIHGLDTANTCVQTGGTL